MSNTTPVSSGPARGASGPAALPGRAAHGEPYTTPRGSCTGVERGQVECSSESEEALDPDGEAGGRSEQQGQELFYPPNVKGWDGGKTWLNSTTVLQRGNWVTDVVWGNEDLGMKPFDHSSI